jgi:hypothetical protein
LGKHHSAVAEPDADTDAEPDANRFAVRASGVAWRVADFDVRVSDGESKCVGVAVRLRFKEGRFLIAVVFGRRFQIGTP